MSFADKITGLLAPNSQNGQMDDHPIWLRYGSKILGIVGAFFAILFGLWNCFGIVLFNVACLISGIIQMLVGFLVMALEAPVCCMFIEHVKTVTDKIDSRPLWNKAALYCGLAIPPIVICPSLASLFGCGLVFGTGVLYGMMSLGKKGSREDMAAVASPTTMQPGTTINMPPTSDQNVTLMEDPDVWRTT
ncbi:CACFD1 family protein [Megaselia abdita]